MAVTVAGRVSILLLAMSIVVGCSDESATEGGASPAEAASPDAALEDLDEVIELPAGSVTYHEHVAPIVFRSCTTCHRPGEAAPFSLRTYDDLKKRARQVARVTASRYMPPWMPMGARGFFHGDRRLSAREIATFRRWAKDDCPEGDPSKSPPAPEFPEGWQLGEPDLVVTMKEIYEVPAEGHDVFRNFVIPLPVSQTRYVKALELRPGNKRVVHHAVMMIDETPSARREDAKDSTPGFPGMDMADAVPPDGHFLGWTPGSSPHQAPEGMEWRLKPGSDLVLQLHMLPTGKPEKLQPKVGLHFAEKPPTRSSFAVRLRNDKIDLEPGDVDVLEDSFVLPVPVVAHAIRPHAHYLGKIMSVYAELPTGGKTNLLQIDDWDFNWQDEYRYTDPFPLPAGSRIVMRYTFDNTAQNLRNPNSPPKRVIYGLKSSDEMAQLSVQVEVRSKDDILPLQETIAREKLRRHPRSASAHEHLGNALVQQGRVGEAMEVLKNGLAIRDDPQLHSTLGDAYSRMGEWKQALRHYLEAHRRRPDDSLLNYNIGIAFSSQNKRREALPYFRRATELTPGDMISQIEYAKTLQVSGKLAEAETVYALVAEAEPENGDAYLGLGLVRAASGRPDDALAPMRQSIALCPPQARAARQMRLAWLLAARQHCTPQEAEEAIRVATAAVRGGGGLQAMDALAASFAAAGRFKDAVKVMDEALQGARKAGAPKNVLASLQQRRASYAAGRRVAAN